MSNTPDLFTLLCDWNNLWLAFQKAARGKRGRPSTAAFEFMLADNLIQLQAELEEKNYHPGRYHSFYIHEPKKRLISAAPFRDRVIHHALCNITIPFFERLFIADSYANRPGKGTHRALDRCQQFARRYPYYLQCDLVQFFPSIDHNLLRHTLYHMLPDSSLNWLIDRILASGQGLFSEEYQMIYYPGDDLFAVNRPRGLPIGNLTSQWWANCYMNPLDQFVRRELGCRAYLRYVDDFILFSDSKSQLTEWRKAIINRLNRFRLSIHAVQAISRPVADGIRFLGFVVFPEHRLLKRRKGVAYQRKLRHLLSSGSEQMIYRSLQGWINHVRYADTYGLRRAILDEFGLLSQETPYG